jgi:secreted PhoX family phosphatase
VTAVDSQWPGNKGYGRPGRPRSATIVITRTDGGVIGA